ncbi:MAG TPA: HAD family hydrolase [Caldithrix sp.]|nr:HAD family hydrolase [Caldithrix sp.]
MRKLLLFDIDGTLILTGGKAAGYMAESVSRVLQRPIQWNIRDFVGNTDRNIIQTLLRRNGGIEPLVDEMTEQALQIYLNLLAEHLKPNSHVQILPGVLPLLKKLSKDNRFALGLLTGNMREGARIKLAKKNLFDFFPIGAFGDDALKREDLPSFALRRAEKYYRCFFERKGVWIIGDSTNDIQCAQLNHMSSLAVASGHMEQSELAACHPTALLPDLSDTKKVIRILAQ